jgi:hypothetical protein
MRSRRDFGRRSRRAIVAAGTNVRIPPAKPRPTAVGRPRRVRGRLRAIACIIRSRRRRRRTLGRHRTRGGRRASRVLDFPA